MNTKKRFSDTDISLSPLTNRALYYLSNLRGILPDRGSSVRNHLDETKNCERREVYGNCVWTPRSAVRSSGSRAFAHDRNKVNTVATRCDASSLYGIRDNVGIGRYDSFAVPFATRTIVTRRIHVRSCATTHGRWRAYGFSGSRDAPIANDYLEALERMIVVIWRSAPAYASVPDQKDASEHSRGTRENWEGGSSKRPKISRAESPSPPPALARLFD